MSAKIKVSVITPAYNAGKYIRETIESILNQTFSEFEFIIIDDCSTDNTWEIIHEYEKRDSRIRAIKNETNLGIAGNRNKGIRLAQGEYIVWQDADDISIPTRIERQLRYMEVHPRVGIVGGFLEFFSDNGSSSGMRKYCETDSELRKNIFRYSPVAQPAAMIRKQCLDEVGEYDLRYPPAEDLDMSFRIGKKHEFANIQEVVIRYREHPSSATFTRLKKIELSTLEIRRQHAKSGFYRMTFFDKIYNALQFFSIFMISPKMKIRLFNIFRNSKA